MKNQQGRRHPLIWAHRGASAHFPENTLSAFQGAIDAGADGVELDVHLTKDGQLVVTHDEDTIRVTGVQGKIADLTLDEIQRLNFAAFRADSPFETAPTLDAVLDLIAPTGLSVNIELKNSIEPYPGMEERILALVHEKKMGERVLYSSFNFDSMARVKLLDPSARVGLLYVLFDSTVFRRAKEINADAIHPLWRLAVLPPYVMYCHRHGLKVHGWTIDNELGLRACRWAGADAVITNDPARAVCAFVP